VRNLLALLLLLEAARGADAPKLKEILEPSPETFPLRPYAWEEWESLPVEAKHRAKGIDPAEWTEPPPEPSDEPKKPSKPPPPGLPKYPQDRHPGFRFDERLDAKRRAFEALPTAWSASALEGLLRRLDRIDQGADRLAKVVAEAAEAYGKVKQQYDNAAEVYARNYEQRHGRRPDVVELPASLLSDFYAKSRRLQELVSLQQSERRFEAWLVGRIAELVLALSEPERAKPMAVLAEGLRDRDWRVRVRSAEILARTGAAGAAALDPAIDAETDPMVLGPITRALARTGADGLMDRLAKRLDDPRWQVRAAVIAALGGMRTKESVDLLVARFPKEDGRLRDDLNAALRAITGRRMDPHPEAWRLWWETERASWTPASAAREAEGAAGAAKEGVYFYGIRTSSKRIVFCIDISGSMAFPLDGQGGTKPPRIETAKRELLQALAALSEDAWFSIVTYGSTVATWKRRPIQATVAHKQEARKFVEQLRPSGATNIFDALVESMEVAAAAGKRKDADEADTIFFLTDGQPTHGRIVDPAQILEEITARNRLHGIVIHAIGVSKEQNAGFLLNLARRNGGEYVAHR
jgi:hypothetical protein